MKTYHVYQVDAFTKDRFTGNPAGVVTNADGLSDSQMQSIARELNHSETAFILSPSADDHDVWVRFFTPTTEVPSCGHATVSAHYVRAVEGELPTSTTMQRIGIGVLPVDIVQEQDDYQIVMTQGRPEFGEVLSGDSHAQLLNALNLTPADLDTRLPVQIVSTGHSKVMIAINQQAALHKLQPDFTALANLSNTIGCNGYYVFTLDSQDAEILAHGRMFAPAIGIPEDPVTGNANGPCGAFLTQYKVLTPKDGRISFRAKQGEAMGRPGIVSVTVECEGGVPKLVRVAGEAVIVFQTTIGI